MAAALPRAARRAREIARTREDILAAASRVFAREGFHGATMQAIAREAGYTAASLYTYFPGKDDLYEALLADLKAALLATFDAPVPAGLTLQQALELLIGRQLGYVAERRDLLRLSLDLGPTRMKRDQGPAELIARLATWLQAHGAGQLRLPAAEAARVLFGLTHAAFVPALVAGATLDTAREAARVADYFLHGVGKPAPRR